MQNKQTLKKKLKAEGTQSTRKQWNKKEKGWILPAAQCQRYTLSFIKAFWICHQTFEIKFEERFSDFSTTP